MLLHAPELRVHIPKLVLPFIKVTVPVDAVGETLAASNTPLPEAVPATGIAAPFTVAASVVVVGEVTMKLRLEEVLALKAVAEVISVLSRLRANIIGVVLNQVSQNTSSDGYSYYGYYRYGQNEYGRPNKLE